MNLTNFKFEIEFNEFICRNLFIFFFPCGDKLFLSRKGIFFEISISGHGSISAGSLYFRNGLSIFLEL